MLMTRNSCLDNNACSHPPSLRHPTEGTGQQSASQRQRGFWRTTATSKVVTWKTSLLHAVAAPA